VAAPPALAAAQPLSCQASPGIVRAVEKLLHLGTFVALIYGLALANVLAHFSHLIKHGRNAGWYWLHTLWAIFLMLMMAGSWWTLQNWAAVPNITFPSYLSMLLVPSLMFIAADLLFPKRGTAGVVDLKTHFFNIKKPLFLLIIAIVAADELDTVLKGWQHVRALGLFYFASQVFWYGICVIGIRSQSERVQGTLVCVSLLVYVGAMINALAAIH